METKIPQKRKQPLFTPSIVLNILLIVGVLVFLSFVFYTPRTDFFKGDLLTRPQVEVVDETEKPHEVKMPGAIIIDYITKETEASVDGNLITLTNFLLEAKNEEIMVSSFLFEFEGADEEYSIKDVKLLVDGNEIESLNYIWISPSRLLVEVSSEEVKVKDRLPVILKGVLENVNPGQQIVVFLSDVSATGLSLNKAITNIGAKGDLYTVGTVLSVK